MNILININEKIKSLVSITCYWIDCFKIRNSSQYDGFQVGICQYENIITLKKETIASLIVLWNAKKSK